MRVLHVIQAFYPCQIWGGPPQNTLILCKGLQSRGYSVEVLTTNILDYKTRMKPESFRADWDDIPVTYLNAHWRGRRDNSMGFIVAPDLLRFRHLIHQADWVHIHGYRHFLFVGASLLARKYGVPYMVQARGALTGQFGRVRLKRVFDDTLGRFILRRAAAVIALSDTEIEQYHSFGVASSKITKIYNPFDASVCPDLPDGKAFRQTYGMGDTEKVVLFLSRLHERKGLDLLVQTIAALGRTDVRLCIVGPDDGYLDRTKQLISEYGLGDRATIVGPLYGREKYDAFRAADVYVLPTRGGEGMPTTILEACYAGVPIVVTNTTEAARIIDGRAGIAVKYDCDELQQAIAAILDDPIRSAEFRRQAASVLKDHFDLENALDKFNRTYHNYLRMRAGTS